MLRTTHIRHIRSHTRDTHLSYTIAAHFLSIFSKPNQTRNSNWNTNANSHCNEIYIVVHAISKENKMHAKLEKRPMIGKWNTELASASTNNFYQCNHNAVIRYSNEFHKVSQLTVLLRSYKLYFDCLVDILAAIICVFGNFTFLLQFKTLKFPMNLSCVTQFQWLVVWAR